MQGEHSKCVLTPPRLASNSSCVINWQLGTLTLCICDRFDPRGPPGNSDGTNPKTRAESWGKSPEVAQGGGDVGAWN